MMYQQIWFSDRMRIDEKGFIRVDNIIKFDRSLRRAVIFSPDVYEYLEQVRKKTPSEKDLTKNLLEEW